MCHQLASVDTYVFVGTNKVPSHDKRDYSMDDVPLTAAKCLRYLLVPGGMAGAATKDFHLILGRAQE